MTFFQFLTIFENVLAPNFQIKDEKQLKPAMFVHIARVREHIEELRPSDHFCRRRAQENVLFEKIFPIFKSNLHS